MHNIVMFPWNRSKYQASKFFCCSLCCVNGHNSFHWWCLTVSL